MAKHRVMIYHEAGSPRITVEQAIRAEVDGETLEKFSNVYIDSKVVMDKLAELETLIDTELNTTDDPATAQKFATEIDPN